MMKVLWILGFFGAMAAISACKEDSGGNTIPTGNNNTDNDSDTDVDDDGDGLPDWWEIKYFGNLDQDGFGDPDGDGASNSIEYLRGTDPTVKDAASTDTGDGVECAAIPWQVELEPFNLLVLLDRSGSMLDATIGDKTYADVVGEALDEVVRINTASGIINFALNVFPSVEPCSVQYWTEHLPPNDVYRDLNVDCSAASAYTGTGVAADPTVPFSEEISADTYDRISSALKTVGQCGGTPICNTLKWARTYLDQLKNDGKLTRPTYVLLATDGAPNCNKTLNPDTCQSGIPGIDQLDFGEQCLDDTCANNAALGLSLSGYPTFIIGVGEEAGSFADVLNTIAYWGGGHNKTAASPADGTWYYQANNAASLTAALENVTNAGVSCEYEIDWSTIDPWVEELGRTVALECRLVKIQGVPADGDSDSRQETVYAPDCSEGDGAFGWRWGDAALKNASWVEVAEVRDDVSKCKKVQLCPKACNALKVVNGVKQWSGISASFGCEPQIGVD
jgi:hypothetical protein